MMMDIGVALRAEMTRIAREQAREMTQELRDELRELKRGFSKRREPTTAKRAPRPPSLKASTIRRNRQRLGLTQAELAALTGKRSAFLEPVAQFR